MTQPEPLTDADRQRIARRYPPARGRWVRITVAGTLAVLLLAWTVWAGLSHTGRTLHAEIHSYTVVSDQKVEATISVHRRDPGVAGRCTLHATSAQHVRVGETTVTFPPGTEVDQQVKASVRTVDRAVTAQLEDCHTDR